MFIISAVCVSLHRYAYWPYGTFKRMGIPGPNPVPFFGTMLAYRKVSQYNLPPHTIGSVVVEFSPNRANNKCCIYCLH